ncbi:MAG TPA: sigma-70 family RNA polymerase sigma factor [Thermoanaerobaculia bacterium]|nr:sigma-70 family RNA polymerase sigma factor [Thermoanaerobaculia bacterium]
MTPAQMFLDHLPHIDKVVTYLCRKHHFRKEECEDFRSHVHIKLIEDDYAVLRKFQGRSSLKTYLTTVVVNLMKDYQNHLWGKWRPSAEAERLGPTAILLERLLVRDRYSFEEAVQVLQVNHKVEMSRQDLAELAGRLPTRFTRQMEGEEGLREIPSPDGRADGGIVEDERGAARRKVAKALPEALKILSDEDRLILEMRMNGFTIAQISRTLRLDQKQEKQLYRRIPKIYKDLREELGRLGITKEDIDDLFDD